MTTINNKLQTILNNANSSNLLNDKQIKELITDIVKRLPKEAIDDKDLINLIAVTTNSKALINHNYSKLASSVIVNHMQETLPNKFQNSIQAQYDETVNGHKSPRISDEIMQFIDDNTDKLQSMIKPERDFIFDFAQIQSYIKTSLRRDQYKNLAETPQQMFLRVAIGVSNPKLNTQDRLKEIEELYHQYSTLKISPQSPIIVHAGSKYNQMPSCYLQYCEDSMAGGEEYELTGKVNGIAGAIAQMAQQGKSGGATGINISDIRSKGSIIKKTGGVSNGLVPFMKMFDSTIGAVNQGGRRMGVCALYLEPWHADIMEFLGALEHFTPEEKRCKNLFLALYTNDLFFERMIKDGVNAKWTLFDPAIVLEHCGKSLSDMYGEEFKTTYLELEEKGLGTTIQLDTLWSKVCHLIQINGNPYIVHKDSINAKTNQSNQGIIKGSNVCCEVTLVSDKDNTGVCVLSSISLPKFVDVKTKDFDFMELIETAKLATRSLNNVLDIQHYPTMQTRNSATNSRAIGIGAQGLADVFAMLELDFDSEQAKFANKCIYECIYYGCLVESCDQAKLYGTYNLYNGSPMSKGILQHDMWGIKDGDTFLGAKLWGELRANIAKYGVRNSEVTALMPTASSSIRMGNTEMHEPLTRAVFVRSYTGGEFLVVNQYLVQDLTKLGLWDQNMANEIISKDGSIQDIASIPKEIRLRYRTAYELPYKELVKMMADRSPFVSQSASFNHYVDKDNIGLTAITERVLFGWKKGLKTLSYYFHTGTASKGKMEMGIATNKKVLADKSTKVEVDSKVCNINDPNCESCQS